MGTPVSNLKTIPLEKIALLRRNIFSGAHAAINNWQDFPWHRDINGEVQSDKPHSSQALAIDVFGAIKVSPAKDTILNFLAEKVGLPSGGEWRLELEWVDDQRLLKERRPTQVDALVVGSNAIMVVECKFTEKGGECSQTRPRKSGTGVPIRQCNGRYEIQTNPVSGIDARCALSGKGIRYWDVIPRLYDLDPEASYVPCPFKGEAFQWMRNMALAHELEREEEKPSACVIAYAAGGNFPTETKVNNLDWLPPMAKGARPPHMISFQQIAQLAAQADPDPCWSSLQSWISDKVNTALRH